MSYKTDRSPTARRLVLDLVTARPRTAFSIQTLCRAGQYVGQTDASVRMAVKRLNGEGILERLDRGRYRLVPRALPTYSSVAGWAGRDDLLVSWDGGWLGVVGPVPGVMSRQQTRDHQRALELAGYRSWRGGLSVRPDNLRGGVRAQRRQLAGAGLNPDATVITLADLPREALAEVRGLWAVEPLLSTHRRLAMALRDSRARRGTTSREEFARESLELGSEVIAAIIRDPLLPGTICPPAPRRRLIAMMGAYQREAQQLWAELLDLDS